MILNNLNEEENSFYRLAGNLPGIVYRVLIEDDNRMIFFNNMVQTMTGYSPEDLKKGKVCSIDPLILLEDKLKVINTVKEAVENNVPFEVEYRINSKNGAVKWFFERGRPVNVDNGKPSYIDGVIFDITDQKEVEKKLKKSEEQYRILSTELETIIDHYPGLAFYKDTNNNFIRINQKIVDYYNSDTAAVKANLTKKDIEGKNLFDLLPKDTAQAYWDDDLEVIKSGTPKLNIEESFETEHGTKWLNSNKIPYYDENGEIRGIIGFSIDITESKKAEQILIESEKKFKLLYENAPLGYQSVDSNGKILEINKAWINFFGYSKEEVIGKWFGDFIGSDYLEVFNTCFLKFKETGEICETELKIIKKDGSHAIVLFDGNISYDENGNFMQTHCIFQDITEQKQIQNEIREKQATLESIFRAAPIGIGMVKNRVFTQVNDLFCRLVGYTRKELLNKNARIIYPSDEDYEYVGKEKYAQIAKFGIGTVETRFQRKDGIIFDILLRSVPLDSNNLSAGVTFTAMDITERKKIEIKLKESEEKYRNLTEQSLIGFAVIQDNVFKYINQRYAEIGGYSVEEMINWQPGEFIKTVHPADREKVMTQSIKKQRGDKNVIDQYTFQAISKTGEAIWIELYSKTIMYENRLAVLITIIDITDRKKAEQKLIESEEKYRYLFDSAQVGLYWSRISDGKILECNNTFAKLFGYDTREECLADYNTIEHYIDPNARSEILKEIRYNKEVKNYVIHVTRRDDTPIWLSISARMFEKENRIEGAAIDITERKQAERELQLERDNFLNILNSMEDGVYIVDQNYDLEFVNPSLIKEFGQFEGMKCFKYFEDRNEICLRCKNKEIFQGKTVRGEWFSFKNQKTYDVIDTPLKNPDESISKLGIFRDATRNKQAEKIIKESKEKFRKQNVFLSNILESLTHPFYVINADDYTITLTNSTASSEGLEEGQYCYSLTHNRNKPCKAPCKCPLEEVKETKRACVVEHTHYDKEGNEKIYEIYGYPILDESGNVVQMIEYTLNITDRKKAENDLRKIAHQWRTTFDAMSESVFLLDIEQNILQCNKATLDILGKEKYDEIIGHSCCEIMHGTNEPVEWCPMIRMIESSHKQSTVAQLGDKWCEISSDPVINDEGTLIGAVHIITDITERKKTEQKLIESEDKFRTIAERSLMGILIIQDNQVKYINEALVNMLEYSQNEKISWELDDLIKLIHPEDLPFLDEYRKSLRSGKTSFKPYFSYRVFTKSGKIKWIDQFSKEIRYKGKSAELVTVMDITETKEAEQELIKLNNLKSELLRRTSHELKTPLVSIKGFSDLLLELHRDKLDDYVIRTIEQIRMGCYRLESLVNDILKTSELESGTVELKKSKGDLSLLIKICVSELEGLSELRNHTINLEISDNLICSFEKAQIYNVITNILSNAIKFTPFNGKIEIKSEVNKDFIIISIKDNGIGFSKEERSLIFKQFGKIERYGQGYDVISEGSGLGLYISKKIIEMHGGEIWIESEGRDKGSTFYFSVPII